MAKSQSSWGIEVGANALKAMKLVRSGDEVKLVKHDVLPFKDVLTTPDLNVAEAIEVNLDLFNSRHDLHGSQVVVSIPGHLSFARFAKMPPVEPKRLPEIVKFEAVQQIPFPIDQVEWDYQVFQQPDSPDVEVGIFAITRERLMDFLATFNRVGFHIDALTLSPLAVYNALLRESGDADNQDGTVYLDIGSQSTDVIILQYNAIWIRTLPFGGNNFTEALVRAFKLSFAKAEKLKREAGTSKYARQIFQAMRPVFTDLVQELQRTLSYYQSANRDVEFKKIIGVGSTLRLPGLRKFLQQQLQIDVVRLDGFTELEIEDKLESEFADIALNMATAYGCALQGLGLERVNCNLLPGQILAQRTWASKRKWFVLTAASMAAAAVVGLGSTIVAQHAFQNRFQEVLGQMNPLVEQARAEQNNLANIRDPQTRIENFQRLLDYRELWPSIIADITQAVATINTPETLTRPDYQSIAQIPRAQRQQVMIDEITAYYVPQPTSRVMTAGRGSAAQTGGTPAIGITGVRELRLDSFFPAEAPPATAGTPPRRQAAAEVEHHPPRFEVVLSGTTPMNRATAARVLSDTIVKWLDDNRDRENRPYRIVLPPEVQVLEVSLVQVTEGAARRPDQPVGGTAPPARGGIAPPARGGITPPARGGGGIRPATPEPTAAAPQAEVPRFEHPLASEDRSQDTAFTIRWMIELKHPNQARQAEQLIADALSRWLPTRIDPAASGSEGHS